MSGICELCKTAWQECVDTAQCHAAVILFDRMCKDWSVFQTSLGLVGVAAMAHTAAANVQHHLQSLLLAVAASCCACHGCICVVMPACQVVVALGGLVSSGSVVRSHCLSCSSDA